MYFTVENLINACEMRIKYVDVSVITSLTTYYGLTESNAIDEYGIDYVLAFSYDAKTQTLALVVEG